MGLCRCVGQPSRAGRSIQASRRATPRPVLHGISRMHSCAWRSIIFAWAHGAARAKPLLIGSQRRVATILLLAKTNEDEAAANAREVGRAFRVVSYYAHRKHRRHRRQLRKQKRCRALSCRPGPNTPPGPMEPGRTWGGAGQNNLPPCVSICQPPYPAYIWRWPWCPGRCPRVLPLPCSSLHPYRAPPAPFPCLGGWPCFALLPR